MSHERTSVQAATDLSVTSIRWCRVQMHRESNGEADSVRGTPIGEVDIIIWPINRAISGPFHASETRCRMCFREVADSFLWEAR